MLSSVRWRLIGIGAEKCRIENLELNFSDPHQDPVPALIQLRNGGGKTALLGMYFSHLLPHARDFLKGKSKHTASLADHVQEGDTSHVAAEWCPSQSRGVIELEPNRFVTAMVAERKPGTRDLRRVFYLFRSSPVLNLDNLPWRQGQSRLSLSAYKAELDRISAEHPEISLMLTEEQGRWTEMLRSIGIDQEVLRYQKRMNEGEGDASNFMDFRTSDEFVERLLKVVTPTQETDHLAGIVNEFSEKVQRTPTMRLELEMIEQMAPRLEQYLDALKKTARLDAALGANREAGMRLRAQLAAAHGAVQKEKGDLERQIQEWEQEQAPLVERREQINLMLVEIGYRQAVADEEACRERQSAAKRRVEAAAAEAKAWELVEPVLDLGRAEAELEELARTEDARTREAEPLRQALERCEQMLRRRLEESAGLLEAEAEQDEERAKSEKQAEADLRRRSRERHDERIRLGQEMEQVRRRLGELDGERSRLRHEGVLGAGESLAGAHDRMQAESRRVAERLPLAQRELSGLRVSVRALGGQRSRALEERSQLASEIAVRSQRVEAAEAAAVRLRARPVLGSLWESEECDPWRESGVLEQRLEAELEGLERELIDLELDSADDRRALASLEQRQTLPPSREVTRGLEILEQAGIRTAYEGWRFLEQSVRPIERARLLRRVPELVGGIVVSDAAELEAARRALAAAELRPTTIVGLGTPDQMLAGEQGSELWEPAAALYDTGAGELETALRQAAVESADARREQNQVRSRDLRSFAAELQTLLFDHPASALAEDRAAIAAACPELEKLDQALAQMAEQIDREQAQISILETEIQELQSAQTGLQLQIGHLGRWLREEAQEEALRERERDLPELTARAFAEERELEAAAEDASQQATGLGARASARQMSASVLREEAVRLPAGDGFEEGLAGHDLEQLRTVRSERQRQYAGKVSDSVLAERRQSAERRRSECQAEISGAPESAVMRARQIAAGAGAANRAQRRAGREEADRERVAALELQAAVGAAAEQATRRRQAISRPELKEPLPETADLAWLGARLEEERAQMQPRIGQISALSGPARSRLDAVRNRFFWMDSTLAGMVEYLSEQSAEPFKGERDDANRQLAELRSEQRRLQEERERALKDQNSAGNRVLSAASAPRFAPLPVLQSRLTSLPEEMEAADSLLQDLRRRLPSLRADLDRLAEDKAGVAERLYDQVRKAARNIANAERASKLPEGLEPWTGIPFVHIEWEPPKSKERWLQVCEQVVGEFADHPDWINGFRLLWEAIRRANAAGRFRVSMLQPDARLTTQRYPVEELKFSEGQELTAAILLYCTFVNLRVRNHEATEAASAGTLVLDNPIGKASLGKLIDLQMKVAQATGVHLVVTTHVHDPEALARFPRRIALRAAPAARGDVTYLVKESEAPGIQAAHLHVAGTGS